MCRSLVVAVMAIMPMVGLANQNSRPDIQVNVPPEVSARAVSRPSPAFSAAFTRIRITPKAR